MQFGSALRINPFAKLLLFFLAGIISGSLFHLKSIIWLCLLVTIVMVLTCILLFITFRPVFQSDRISGFIAAFLFVSAGLLNSDIHYQHVLKLKETTGFKGQVLLRIDEETSETTWSVKCFARIEKVYDQEPKFRKRQKILVNFEKDSYSGSLLPGDRLKAEVSLVEVPAPGNPEEFDYHKYLASKRIINQTFIGSDTWHLVEEKYFSPRGFSNRLKQALIMKYRCTGLNPKLLSILSAVTLGYKNDLDAQTKQAFSKAGVMHVMALSGFNVAVIAFGLNYLMFFLLRIKYGNYIRLAFVILFIWFFAFITGFSPSVTRASLMISLVLTGKELRKNLNGTNILYASAFMLIALQPALIYDVGFQLSFAAVFGIIVFQRSLMNLIYFKSRIISMIWQLFTVSLAAQLATTPLTMAYFHQFPVYFWITNLYVVPLVSMIISLAMLFFILSLVQPAMLIIGKILGLLVTLLYKSVSIIEIMPFSVISDIRINTFQLILLMSLLIVASMYLSFRKKQLIIIALSIFILFQITGIIINSITGNQQIILIGQLRNTTFINLIEGKNSMIISDNLPDSSQLKYSFGNFWIKKGIASHSAFKLNDAGNLVFNFDGKNIVLAASPESMIPENADILIITGKVNPSADYFSDNGPSQVILDSSVPDYKEKEWGKICLNNHLSLYSVKKEGAWILTAGYSLQSKVPPVLFLAGQ